MSSRESAERSQPGQIVTTLDDVDRRIVELLRADGRMSMRALAEHAHISRANAYTRLDRLRNTGVITGFRAVIDPERFGYTVSAYVAVRLRQRSWHEFVVRLNDIPEVEHAAMVSGDHDGLLLVRATDTRALRDIVLERLQAMPEVLGTETMFILDESSIASGLVVGQE